jgi:hypothetical protein
MTREYIAMFYCIFTILLLAERNGVENREWMHLGRAAITKKITDEKFLSNMKFHSTVI